ncbi:MAG: twin-arginine translocase TatA/TatE family subunit [Demequina sp.]
MLGINGGELLIIIAIAMIVVGPERLPEYAQQFRAWVVRGRDYVRRSQSEISRDLGSDVDWSTLDPRQYDPRTIVREAFAEQDGSGTGAYTPSATPTAGTRERASSATLEDGTPAPFDAEAT